MTAVDPKLLEILVCPLCKGKLVYRKPEQELVCKADRLALSGEGRHSGDAGGRGAQAAGPKTG